MNVHLHGFVSDGYVFLKGLNLQIFRIAKFRKQNILLQENLKQNKGKNQNKITGKVTRLMLFSLQVSLLKHVDFER